MRIGYFDLETQYLFKDVGGRENTNKLKVAVAGILIDNEIKIFEEENLSEMIDLLKSCDLIVGHNLIRFDYVVLEEYVKKEDIALLKSKTFDIMLYFDKIVKCWPSLDDLGSRNLGMKKTEESIKIPQMWRDGEKEKVKNYLKNDLKLTEAVYMLGKNNKKLKYEHKNYGKSVGEREIDIDW